MKYADIYAAIAAEAKGVRELSRGALDIGYTRKDIEYLMVSEDGKTLNKKTVAIAIFNPDSEAEEAYYIGGESKVAGEPEILRDPSPTPPEIRSPYLSEEEYLIQIKSTFLEWEVLKMATRVEGDFDILEVVVADARIKEAMTQYIMAWQEGKEVKLMIRK